MGTDDVVVRASCWREGRRKDGRRWEEAGRERAAEARRVEDALRDATAESPTLIKSGTLRLESDAPLFMSGRCLI